MLRNLARTEIYYIPRPYPSRYLASCKQALKCYQNFFFFFYFVKCVIFCHKNSKLKREKKISVPRYKTLGSFSGNPFTFLNLFSVFSHIIHNKCYVRKALFLIPLSLYLDCQSHSYNILQYYLFALSYPPEYAAHQDKDS